MSNSSVKRRSVSWNVTPSCPTSHQSCTMGHIFPESGTLETRGTFWACVRQALPVPCNPSERLVNSTRREKSQHGCSRASMAAVANPSVPLTPLCIAVCDQLLPAPTPRIRLPQASVLHPLCGSVG